MPSGTHKQSMHAYSFSHRRSPSQSCFSEPATIVKFSCQFICQWHLTCFGGDIFVLVKKRTLSGLALPQAVLHSRGGFYTKKRTKGTFPWLHPSKMSLPCQGTKKSCFANSLLSVARKQLNHSPPLHLTIGPGWCSPSQTHHIPYHATSVSFFPQVCLPPSGFPTKENVSLSYSFMRKWHLPAAAILNVLFLRVRYNMFFSLL